MCGNQEKDTKYEEYKMKKVNMKYAKALTTKKKNIVGNFRGKEDAILTKIRNGMRKFLESPFKKYKK